MLYDDSAALRIAVVERGHVSRLPDQWDEPGNYLLLYPRDGDGVWRCYVGMASPGGVRARLQEHVRKKADWHRAVIVQRDTTHGFNSTQVAWLEGRLYDLIDSAVDAVLNNEKRPGDETLRPFDRATLESCVLPIRRVLRLLGYDPATADDGVAAVASASRSNRFYGVTIDEMIDSGFLAPGTPLVSTNGAWPAEATIVHGGIKYLDTVHSAPSAAAQVVKNGANVNGWDFWATETDTGRVTLATLRTHFQESRAADAVGAD